MKNVRDELTKVAMNFSFSESHILMQIFRGIMLDYAHFFFQPSFWKQGLTRRILSLVAFVWRTQDRYKTKTGAWSTEQICKAILSVFANWTFLRNDRNLLSWKGWSIIVKAIRKFNLNFHIVHTFPDYVKISFSEVGTKEVIAVRRFRRDRDLFAKDAHSPLCSFFREWQWIHGMSVLLWAVIVSQRSWYVLADLQKSNNPSVSLITRRSEINIHYRDHKLQPNHLIWCPQDAKFSIKVL